MRAAQVDLVKLITHNLRATLRRLMPRKLIVQKRDPPAVNFLCFRRRMRGSHFVVHTHWTIYQSSRMHLHRTRSFSSSRYPDRFGKVSPARSLAPWGFSPASHPRFLSPSRLFRSPYSGRSVTRLCRRKRNIMPDEIVTTPQTTQSSATAASQPSTAMPVPSQVVATIATLGNYEGQSVTLKGWLYNSRESGKLLFPIFRDGTGTVQGVAHVKSVRPEVFESLKGLTQESSVIVTGKVRADKRAPDRKSTRLN